MGTEGATAARYLDYTFETVGDCCEATGKEMAERTVACQRLRDALDRNFRGRLLTMSTRWSGCDGAQHS